jgi:hypothetical protein
MPRPLPLAGLLIALLAGAPACWNNHVPAPDAAPTVDPGRIDPNDPVPACSATCEDHQGTLCVSASEGLCTCVPRGNSGRFRLDCRAGWAAQTPACTAGADHGTSCPRALTGMDQVCAGPATNQVCYCSAGLAWRCMVVAN